MKGIFRFHSDCGVPLEDLLDLANTRNWVIGWTDFIDGAKQDGWNKRTILSKIISACNEVYWKEHAAEVEKRLNLIL